MKQKAILFSGPMVKAILDGRKSQTRRVVKLIEFGPSDCHDFDWQFRDRRMRWNDVSNERLLELAPYQPGDILWVRETWADVNSSDGPAICFRADESYWPWEGFSTVFGPDYRRS